MGFLKKIGAFAPRMAMVTAANDIIPVTGRATYMFINPLGSGETYEVMEIVTSYAVAGGAGATIDFRITSTGQNSAGGGSTVLTTDFVMTAPPFTVYKIPLAKNVSQRYVKPGQMLTLIVNSNGTTLSGVCVQITLQPLRRSTYR